MSATLELASRVVWLSEQPHLGPTLLRGFKGTVTAYSISSGWRKGSGPAAQGSFPVTLPSLGPRTLPGGLWGHLSTPGATQLSVQMETDFWHLYLCVPYTLGAIFK